jgi:hypothetical protein
MKSKLLVLLKKLHTQGALTDQEFCDIITEDNTPEIERLLPLKEKTQNYLDIEQHKEIVHMYLDGYNLRHIADTMNKKYGLTLTAVGVRTLLTRLQNGQKRKFKRYQTAAWKAALDTWQTQLRVKV